jgi:molybdopterin converting factor small subunit
MTPHLETDGYHPASRLTSVQRLDSRMMHIGAVSGTHRSAPPVKRRAWSRAGHAVAGAVAVGALVAGARPWFVADAADAFPLEVAQSKERQVTTTRPQRQEVGTISLPSTVEPFQTARLFARVNGYVKDWNAELGAAVKAGDVLAVIDTPDLDQELLQAGSDLNVATAAVAQAEAELAESQATLESTRADLKRSEADLALANSRLKRRQSLFDKNAATADDLDTAIRDRDARQADIAASQAAVRRQAANLKTQAAIIASRRRARDSLAETSGPNSSWCPPAAIAQDWTCVCSCEGVVETIFVIGSTTALRDAVSSSVNEGRCVDDVARVGKAAVQSSMNARRSALILSACVVHMPCGSFS